MKTIKFVVLSLAVSFLLSGCAISFKTASSTNGDGGIFLSQDKGSSWKQIAYTPSINGAPGAFSSLDSSSLAIDPSDSSAFYFGSAKGLYYSFNLSNGWNLAVGGLPQTEITAVAVSPDNKCQIYAASANKVYRSDDCDRTWKEIYFNDDTTIIITSLAIDNYTPTKIYIGTSAGNVFKSENRGQDWRLIASFNFRVSKILLTSSDTRNIFVSTNGDGIKRSVDGGDNWEDLKKDGKMTAFNNNYKIITLENSVTDRNLIYAASNNGIFISTDNGDNWSALKLLTEKGATINDLKINPKNPSEIYYVSNTTFYSSVNGGINWRTVKLPSSRAGWKLLLKTGDVNTILMGMKKYQTN